MCMSNQVKYISMKLFELNMQYINFDLGSNQIGGGTIILGIVMDHFWTIVGPDFLTKFM